MPAVGFVIYREPEPVFLCPTSFPDCVLTCTEDPYPVVGPDGTSITGIDGVFAVGYYGETALGLTTSLVPQVGPITVKSSAACFVDADYLYIYNNLTSNIEKYSKSTLLLVDSLSGSFAGGCTDSSNIMWLLYGSSIRKYTKSPLALKHTYDFADLGEYATTTMIDIAVDNEYIYIIDDQQSIIQRRMKQCLCLDQKVGDLWVWGTDVQGVAVSGDYIYIADYYHVIKANKDTWQIEEYVGDRFSRDTTLGRPESAIYPYDVMTYGGYLYVLGYYGIARWNENDLTICGKPLVTQDGAWDEPGHLGDSYRMCTDGTYLYISNWDGMAIKYNLETGVFLAEHGDRTYEEDDGPTAFSFPFGIAADGTYTYVLDQNDEFRIVKLLSSDMSYVTEYRSINNWEDPGGHQWSNPQYLMYHDGYLYISDPNYPSSISRIDKDTMLYVDTTIMDFNPGDPGDPGNGELEGMVVDGDYMYVGNYHYDPCAVKLTFPDLEFVSTHPLITTVPDVEIMGKVTGITVDETYVYVTCNIERISNPLIGANEIRIYNKLTFEFIDSFPVTDGKPRSPAVDGTHIYFTITNTTYSTNNTDYVKKCLKASPYTEIDSYSSVGADFRSCDVAGLYQLNQ